MTSSRSKSSPRPSQLPTSQPPPLPSAYRSWGLGQDFQANVLTRPFGALGHPVAGGGESFGRAGRDGGRHLTVVLDPPGQRGQVFLKPLDGLLFGCAPGFTDPIDEEGQDVFGRGHHDPEEMFNADDTAREGPWWPKTG
ncbi:hypothetical protein LX36DRAFT_698734 [Colletotrichum falcatum]|nr:hypothetical protein LX36DRAFT_698734 [Colletotrichum falcatum]